MRTFEVMLILVNLLSLFWGLKSQAKTILFGVAAANLIGLTIHGIFEGLRYQMAFAYLLAALTALFAIVKASRATDGAGLPDTLRRVATGLGLALLVATVALASALPVFTLPTLTGDYAVGIRYFQLVDEKRSDPFLSGSTQKRALMVKIYYPAKPDDSRPFSPYFHGSAPLIEAFASFYGLPDFAFDHLALVKTHAKDGLEVSDRESSYPVVLFSHGAGTTMEIETSQSENLASHGYIVVDIDHTYVSAATLFPDRIVLAQQATTNFDTPEPAEPITQIMAEDAGFVIEKLGELNAGSLAPGFEGKLNLAEIGAIGHSVGGATAYNLALNNKRIKAAINLDGAVYITPGNITDMAPFLMLANDREHLQAIQNGEGLIEKFADTPEGQQELLAIYGSRQAYQQAADKAQQNIRGLAGVLRASGNLYTITGSAHMKFADLGLFIGLAPLRELIGIGGQTAPARCLEISEALTLAFFDQHLKTGAANALSALLEKYPELKRVDLK